MNCSCGNTVPFSIGRGHPAKYCSDRCASRERKRAQRERDKNVTDIPVTEKDDIRFYCGINEQDWNHHPVAPGPYACIAPVYGKTATTKKTSRVTVPADVQGVIIDSSAFVDRFEQGGKSDRLSFEDAKKRQIAHAYQFRYVEHVTHVASYDLLIDEKWQDGERSKQRWSQEDAEYAVRETVAAATSLAKQRHALSGVFGHSVGLVLSAQGVEVGQYLRCAEKIVPLMDKEHDIFGLGGWCITGLLPSLILPSFKRVMQELIPYLASQGVKYVHIWGVIFPEALAALITLCTRYGVKPSTDSSGPCRYPILGQWGYGSWRDNSYKTPPILSSCKALNVNGEKAPSCEPGTHCRGLERIRHVERTREYLSQLSEREPLLIDNAQKEGAL
jgi:hypothetical protein